MTKTEYMKTLSHKLRRLPKEDYDRAIEYFEEYFAEAGAENEQQAVTDLGTPEEAAKTLIMDLAAQNIKEKPQTVKRGLSTLWIAVLAVCSAPITLPIAICILAVIAILLVCIAMCIGCAVISAAAFAASGILSIIGGIFLLFQSVGNGLATIGFGMFITGASTLLVYAAVLLFKWFIRKISILLGKLTKGGRKNEKVN